MVASAQLRLGDVIVVPDHGLERDSSAAIPGARMTIDTIDRQPDLIVVRDAFAWCGLPYGWVVEVLANGALDDHEYGRLDPQGIIWRVLAATGEAGASAIAHGIADALVDDPERIDVDDRADLGDLLGFVLDRLDP